LQAFNPGNLVMRQTRGVKSCWEEQHPRRYVFVKRRYIRNTAPNIMMCEAFIVRLSLSRRLSLFARNPMYLARSNVTALGRSARISRPCSQRSSMFDVLEHFLRPLASVSLKSCWIKPFILNASLHTTKVKLEQRLDLLASKLRIRYMLLSVSSRSRSSRSSRLSSFTKSEMANSDADPDFSNLAKKNSYA